MRLSILLFLAPVLCFGQADSLLFSLDHRIEVATQRLLGDSISPVFTPDFILADVDTSRFGTRRFTEFSGDLSGRYIEVVSMLPRSFHREANLPRLIRQLSAHQQEDGRFGDPSLVYLPDSIGRSHMAQLWGNGRLLVGLATHAKRTGDSLSLATARRLGDFLLDTAMVALDTEVIDRLADEGANGSICLTQLVEGLVLLYQVTLANRYLDAASTIYPYLPDRGQQHSHGYLTTLRGTLMLFHETGEDQALDFVREAVDELLVSDDYTIFGTVQEYFGGRGDRDEGCATADWVRLLFALHDTTRDPRYLAAAQLAYYNGLLANQYAGGDFGNHHYTDQTVATPQPHRAWWCCTMHGLMALLEVERAYQFRYLRNVAAVQLLSEGTFSYKGDVLSIKQVDRSDSTEVFRVTIEDWLDKKFWVLDGHRSLVIEQGGEVKQEPFYPDDRYSITVTASYPVRFHSPRGQVRDLPTGNDRTTGYLTYGPFVMGVRDREFVSEPDWNNTIDPQSIRSAPGTYNLRADYLHGGYAGRREVTLVPVATQFGHRHPYMRVITNFGSIPGK